VIETLDLIWQPGIDDEIISYWSYVYDLLASWMDSTYRPSRPEVRAAHEEYDLTG